MSIIEAYLIMAVDRFPPLASAALLTAAALSFLARHRSQALYGRIREYQTGSLVVAAALGGMALFYLLFYVQALPSDALRGGVRILLALTAMALVYFNWGGVATALRDLKRALTRQP